VVLITLFVIILLSVPLKN